MELIYLYVNQSSTLFIEKKGFNFSSEYNFCVINDHGQYRLEQEGSALKLPSDFFDDTSCITNITGIVGENGSGKTTLLYQILNNCVTPKREIDDEKYRLFSDKRYEEKKSIAVYKTKSGLICYHNIDDFYNNTEIECIKLNGKSSETIRIFSEDKAFRNISKIYLSNSMYSLGDGISTHTGIDEVYFTVNSLNTLKDIFFNHRCKVKSKVVGGFYEFQETVCRKKLVNEFQQILDILYLKYVKEKNIKSIFADNFSNNLEINFCFFEKYLNEELQYENAQEESFIKKYINCFKIMLNSFDKNLWKKDIVSVLYTNLLFEVIVCYRITEKKVIIDKKELIDYVNELIDRFYSRTYECSKYFKNALEEIREYEIIFDKCKRSDNSLPISNLAYENHIIIEFGSTQYDSFIQCINESVFEREFSFILKYIIIGGLKLASGERALLNFFSWLHLAPLLIHFSDNYENKLHDNVLLLIDEIDLYCHPLWQQKLISHLIKEVKEIFIGKKVQIIFATHSPIVLSDIPQSNIIFLKREKDKCNIDESNKELYTFGANIYKLFNNAFFLNEKGQIGEFAKSKIQAIIDEIKPLESNGDITFPQLSENKIKSLEIEISFIGERIIQNKLYDMLKKCSKDSQYLRQKKIEMYEEKIKMLKEGKNYDTD